MKISLNLDNLAPDGKNPAAQALERLILATKEGDFEARDRLVQHYTPFVTSLAKKRGGDAAETNRLIEAGKRGLVHAARKYKTTVGPDKFQVFALDFIEKGMSDTTHQGFFSRLFGKD